MGNVRFGIPEELALSLKEAMGLRYFVETGTYKGGTARWASEHFDKVTTIEAYEPRFKETAARLEGELRNVRFIYGDSGKVLRYQLPVGEAALVWLDAHWCGNYELSLENRLECPLLEELEAVRLWDAVLIDDARLFLEKPPRPHDPAQWPSFEEIKVKMGRGRSIFVCEDVIIVVPERYAGVVRDYTERGLGK